MRPQPPLKEAIILKKQIFKLAIFIFFPLTILLVFPSISFIGAASSIRFVVKIPGSVLADKDIVVSDGCDVTTNAGVVRREGANAACGVVSSGFAYSFKNFLPDLFLSSLDNKKGNWEYYVNGIYAGVSMDKYVLNNGDTLVITLNDASPDLPSRVREVQVEVEECLGSDSVVVRKYKDGGSEIIQNMGKVEDKCGNTKVVEPQPPSVNYNPPHAGTNVSSQTPFGRTDEVIVYREVIQESVGGTETTVEQIIVPTPPRVVQKPPQKVQSLPKTGPKETSYLSIISLIILGLLTNYFAKVTGFSSEKRQ